MKKNPENDALRLRPMLEAAQKARQFVEGKTRTSLENDEQLQFALVRAIEIIGEAGSQVTEEFQREHPQIPWRNVIGMRNRLKYSPLMYKIPRAWGWG